MKSEKPLLKPGDGVEIIETGLRGTVISVTGGRVSVEVGKLSLSLPLEKVRAVENRSNEREDYVSGSPANGLTSSEIDIRGMTVDDVPILIDRFLESMKISGIATGFIIHGKGTGKLGEAVWNYLRRSKNTTNFRIGTPTEGGHGVTVVEVK